MSLQENLYRVVKPYDSNILHSSHSLMGGASKCYKEIKKISPSAGEFSVIQMNTNQVYDFNINNQLPQHGGMNGTVGTTATLSELEALKVQYKSLEKRIIDIENKMNIKIDNKEENNNENENHNEKSTNFNVDVARKFI